MQILINFVIKGLYGKKTVQVRSMLWTYIHIHMPLQADFMKYTLNQASAEYSVRLEWESSY